MRTHISVAPRISSKLSRVYGESPVSWMVLYPRGDKPADQDSYTSPQRAFVGAKYTIFGEHLVRVSNVAIAIVNAAVLPDPVGALLIGISHARG